MKALGWILLLLSALSMAMCTASGPETREFVMSSSGVWVWAAWACLLIGAVSLLVYKTPAKMVLRQAVFVIGGFVAVAAVVATVAVIIPTVAQQRGNAGPSCILEGDRLAAFREQMNDCRLRLSGEKPSDQPRSRMLRNALTSELHPVTDEEYRYLATPGQTIDGACEVPRYDAELARHLAACGGSSD